MHRVQFYKSSLPPSVSGLIPTSAPCPSDDRDHTLHKEWLDTYNTVVFRDSIFFKGPLLAMTTENNRLLGNIHNTTSLYRYKNSLRKLLVELQGSGGSDEWPTFYLHIVPIVPTYCRVSAGLASGIREARILPHSDG